MARAIDGDALIEWFSPYLHTGEPIPADVVIADIRFMPTLIPPNEPLTLEQLREMDGEPVYIEFLPDITGEKLQFWALVEVDAFGDVNLTNNLGGSSPYEEVMGNIEAIYRRPPEKQEDT